MKLKKVLIVDDSELVHKMHGLVLQRYQKCEVLHTYDGNQALEALSRNPDVQLILLDINMPVMDGLRFLEVRQQTGLFTDIPVVIISTEGREDDTARGMALGATGYVKKPFRPAQLHAIIDGLFDSRSGPGSHEERELRVARLPRSGPVTTPEFQEILDDYVTSSRELLEKAESILLAAERAEAALTPDDLSSLKRVFHTLKGNSGMMGFEAVARAAHVMEDALAAAGGGDVAEDEDVVVLLLSAIGMISPAFRAGQVPETMPADWAAALSGLERVASEAGTAAHARPAAGAPAADAAARGILAGRSRSLRVSHASLERLLELTGEMNVLLAGVAERLRRLAARTPSDEAAAATESLELLLRTFGLLEREVFATRLVPVESVFARFRRLVRDLALELGKEVDVVVEGGATTFDKSVVDELAEPLVHLVRNAVDHGIETPAVREANGKPRRATLTLAARQASSLAEVAVLDDGAGIDLEKVRRRAAAMGIATDELDEGAVRDLVFLPAFSTREGVSAISGRGVGLDVVKASVERLGGSVQLRTAPGRGTEFRLAFPLTLAVSDALLVSVDGETYALPVSFLEETVRLEEGELHRVASRGVIRFRDRLVAAVDAGAFLGTTARSAGRRRFASILSGGGRQKALLVDRPLETRRIVVKPLDESLGRPLGLSGATLLGDGRVVMILDAVGILDAHVEKLQAAAGREL